ncbi:MAG: ComEC family competence protein, partial [Proteobacteria bacterium]
MALLYFPAPLPVLVTCAVGAGVLGLIPMKRIDSGVRVALCGVACGVLYTGVHVDYWLGKRLAAGETRLETIIEGVIESKPRRLRGLTRIELRLNHTLNGNMEASRRILPTFYGTVRLNCYDCAQEFATGEVWRLRVRLRGIHGLANPGVFDYERWAFQRRLVASGSIVEGSENRRLARPERHAFSPALRDRLNDFLQSAIDERHGRGVIQAVTIGDREGLSEESWKVFRRTGTSHLVAISGLHISLVFGFLFASANLTARVFPPLLRRVAAQRLAAFVALPPTIYYAWLAGFSLPTQRAAIMLTVFYLAYFLGRRVMGWHTFCSALLLVLLLDPLSPLTQGAWLSFGAVAAIVSYASRARRDQERVIDGSGRVLPGLRHRAKRAFGAWVGVQFAVSAAVLPMSALFFNELSLVSPVVNLIAIPYFSTFVVPPSLLGVLAWLIGAEGLATWCLGLGGDAVVAMQSVLDGIAAAPWASIRIRGVDAIRIALAGVVVAGFSKMRSAKPVAAAALGLLLNVRGAETIAPGAFVVPVLDVGQ